MITNHGGLYTHYHGHDHGVESTGQYTVDQQTRNSTQWFRGKGFHAGSLTTIRRKRSRKVYYMDQSEGDLAHCSVYDMNNDVIVLNEAVINGGTYKLLRFGENIFLEEDQGIFISLNYKRSKFILTVTIGPIQTLFL